MCEKCELRRQEVIQERTAILDALFNALRDFTDENSRLAAEALVNGSPDGTPEMVETILEAMSGCNEEQQKAFFLSYISIECARLYPVMMDAPEVSPAMLLGQWAGILMQSEMVEELKQAVKLAEDARYN